MEVINEQKMNFTKDRRKYIICNKCKQSVKVEFTPYFKKEGNIHFASICPKCGKLIITKE